MKGTLFTLLASVTLVATSLAGDGGISPTPGTYRFEQTSPIHEPNAGAGTFHTPQSGNPTMVTNPASGGPSTKWTKGADGQYRRFPGDLASVCFHATPSGVPPYVWGYKFAGDEVASGKLHG